MAARNRRSVGRVTESTRNVITSPRSEVQVHVCLLVHGALWWVLLHHTIMLRLFFVIKCG